MKVYITTSFKLGENKNEIEQLCSIVKSAGFEDFSFIRDVENYQKVFKDPRQLMVRAREEIQKCDVLLFDASEKSTGRAIEVGIAFSNNKKIIVIMKKGIFIKDTLRGVADAVIEYDNIEEIQENLGKLSHLWTTRQ